MNDLDAALAASFSTSPAHALESAGTVLIVDDLPANARLLSGILKVAGYQVEVAYDGTSALQLLGVQNTSATNSSATNSEAVSEVLSPALPKIVLPDIVLLDVMMPGMDGFEVCRRIKGHAPTAFLPVVMVTALSDANDRVQALEAGADDFLTKPVDNVEVVARVKSLVRVKRQRDELEQAYRNLQRLEVLREGLTHMVVHDLRTPLTSIMGPLEMLLSDQLGPLNQTQKEIVQMCERAGNRLLLLVNELLDVAKMENGELTPDCSEVQPAELVEQALELVKPISQERSIDVHREIAPDTPAVYADDDLISRTLMNLISNAVRYNPAGQPVVVAARRMGNTLQSTLPGEAVLFSVQDRGPGIPAGEQQRIFEKWRQVEARKSGRRYSTGLGLAFCKLAVEAHGGRIWVESEEGHGSTFCFTVPILPAPDTACS